MKKNVLFVLFGAIILLTMNACKTDELDLDKELKFSKLTVEEQKASIEKNGLELVTAMEGMQDTKAMKTIMNMMKMTGGDVYNAPFQKLASDIKNARKSALSNFDKQMRVSYLKNEEDEFWGEYEYDFYTEDIEFVKSLSNKLVVRFPATSSSKTNNAVITVVFEESTIAIPNTEELDLDELAINRYPSKITMSMTVDGAEVMNANFNGNYYTDGSPQEVTQTMTMGSYNWTAQIKNNKKTISESFDFKNGKTTLLKSLTEVKGAFSEDAVVDAMENDSPEDVLNEFAVNFQVMDVAIKGGTTDFKGLIKALNALDYDKLSDKQATQKEADILNKYMACTAYFADADRKFADIELYVVESKDEWSYYDYNQNKEVTQTYYYYDLAPRFILSDGSKVAAEEYVLEGFDKLINKIEDMGNDFDF